MESVRVSFCYAREDERLRNELEQHLGALKHSGQIITWYDRKILPGADWEQEIDIHFRTSDVILLLISSHFLDSEYCYSVEMQKALEMYKAGTAHVIPIILRPVDWEKTSLGKLQVLPTDGKPIVTWRDRHAAMLDVIQGIRQVILFVLTQKMEKGIKMDDVVEEILLEHKYDKNAERAMREYIYSIAKMPTYSWEYAPLEDEKQHEAIEQVLSLDPLNLAAHHWKGGLFFRQKRYQEALAVFEYILQLDPNNALAYRKKGRCLFELGSYEEALEALNCALPLRSDDLNASLFKGHALSALHRHEEALAIFKQILQRNQDLLSMYHYIAQELRFLDRVTEAKQAEHTYSRLMMAQIMALEY
jgi:tetratricopeptide (TPR) repeat protein